MAKSSTPSTTTASALKGGPYPVLSPSTTGPVVMIRVSILRRQVRSKLPNILICYSVSSRLLSLFSYNARCLLLSSLFATLRIVGPYSFCLARAKPWKWRHILQPSASQYSESGLEPPRIRKSWSYGGEPVNLLAERLVSMQI